MMYSASFFLFSSFFSVSLLLCGASSQKWTPYDVKNSQNLIRPPRQVQTPSKGIQPKKKFMDDEDDEEDDFMKVRGLPYNELEREYDKLMDCVEHITNKVKKLEEDHLIYYVEQGALDFSCCGVGEYQCARRLDSLYHNLKIVVPEEIRLDALKIYHRAEEHLLSSKLLRATCSDCQNDVSSKRHRFQATQASQFFRNIQQTMKKLIKFADESEVRLCPRLNNGEFKNTMLLIPIIEELSQRSLNLVVHEVTEVIEGLDILEEGQSANNGAALRILEEQVQLAAAQAEVMASFVRLLTAAAEKEGIHRIIELGERASLELTALIAVLNDTATALDKHFSQLVESSLTRFSKNLKSSLYLEIDNLEMGNAEGSLKRLKKVLAKIVFEGRHRLV